MNSKKVAISGTDAVPVATFTDATLTDVFTTVLSTTEVVSGTYGLIQKIGLVALGMSIQSKRMGGSLNPFS